MEEKEFIPEYQSPEEAEEEKLAETAEPEEIPLQETVQTRRRKPKKPRMGVRMAILALACAILGGAAGSYLTTRLIDNELRKLSALTTDAGTAKEAHSVDIPLSAQKKLAEELSTNVGDKTLAPDEVYRACVDSVVAINKASTSTNVFGQASSLASSGSGFILSEDGYIVTNYHVVEGAEKLTVVFNDGKTSEAEVIGFDSGNDVALLHVEASGLRPVSVGDSDRIDVGEQVCAIGNPLGELTNTLTVGYISALDREINTDGTPINMLQTDCAINAGNSGGPLFDGNGNVIGITTAKYYGSSVEGLCFAIPINDALRIVADLKEYGYVTGKAYLGISVADLPTGTAELYGLPTGVYVATVQEGSCAAKAGLEVRDIITGIGSYRVSTRTELLGALKNFRAGDTTTLSVFRAGAELMLTVILDEKEPETPESAAAQKQQSAPQNETARTPDEKAPDLNEWFSFFFGR